VELLGYSFIYRKGVISTSRIGPGNRLLKGFKPAAVITYAN